MSALTDRASCLRAFFRLVNALSTDDDLTEHDNSTLEGAYHLLQMGAWDAQRLLIGYGAGSRWAKTSSALSFTGSDPDKYAALPADLLRLDSDGHRTSGLRSGTSPWGQEVPFERRFEFSGPCFYLRGNEAESTNEGELRLYLCVNASPPSSLVADYYYKHATLADSTTIDFAGEDRDLVPAFAAQRATVETWFPGGAEEIQLIERHLNFLKAQAWKGSRFSRAPKAVPTPQVYGDVWMI